MNDTTTTDTTTTETTATDTLTPTTTRAAGQKHVPSFPELSLRIRPLHDPVLDRLGHDPRSEYVEQYWLSILGPSAVLLLRRLAIQFDREPAGFDLDLVECAQELGLGARGGKHSPMWRTLDRICRFGLATRNGANLSLSRHLPPLSLRQIERLPAHLRTEHARQR